MPSGLPKENTKKPVATAALFFDEVGKILVVKPIYKNHWGMPGGTVEDNESPSDACVREVREELFLKLDKKKLRFLSVDYIGEKVSSSWEDAFRFVFFAGILSAKQILKIKLQTSELEKMEFVNISDLPKRLSKHTARTIIKSIEAYKKNEVFYLEDGYRNVDI